MPGCQAWDSYPHGAWKSYEPDQRPAFPKARVLVVGDAMLDRYWHGAVDRISPEAPVPVVKHHA
jgi:hypothetical protein